MSDPGAPIPKHLAAAFAALSALQAQREALQAGTEDDLARYSPDAAESLTDTETEGREE